MTAIQPGKKFIVGYGDGESIEVVALGLVTKIEIIEAMEGMAGQKKGGESFRALLTAFRKCVPDITDEALDKLDEGTVGEIIGKTIGKAELSADDKKKLE